MTNEKQKDDANCCSGCRPKRKGCIKLGTGECDCGILCEGERYKVLSDQKDKNEVKKGEVVVYISGLGLAFCAYSVRDTESWVYVVPGILFALTIVAMIESFDSCVAKVRDAMDNIGKPKTDDKPKETRWEKAVNGLLYSSLVATVLATIWDLYK